MSTEYGRMHFAMKQSKVGCIFAMKESTAGCIFAMKENIDFQKKRKGKSYAGRI